MLLSAKKLIELTPRLLCNREMEFTWEYSETLAWIILRKGTQEMTITFRDGSYRINAREGYEKVGYIPTLLTHQNPAQVFRSIRTYFQKGYEDLFKTMLTERCASKEAGIPMEEVFRKLRRKHASTKKPASLEIPPSLRKKVAETVRRKRPSPPTSGTHDSN